MDIPRKNIKRHKNLRRLMTGIIVLVLVGLGGFLLNRLQPGIPTVRSNAILTDKVERGPMLRQVRGIGTLIPEESRWIASDTMGRVEKIVVLPGAVVEPDTVILELSNADLMQDMQNAELQLKASRLELTNLEVQLEGELLGLQSNLAQLEALYKQAKLEAEVNEELFSEGLIAELTVKKSRVQEEQLETQFTIEKKRLTFRENAIEPQLATKRAEVDQIEANYNLLKSRVKALQVIAGEHGILQKMLPEVGQKINPGENLAQVADPTNLKAVIRIPETQARDITIGQSALVDTRNGVIEGRVKRVDPRVTNGTVSVDIALGSDLPRGARADLTVEGSIELEKLEEVLFVGRPAFGRENSRVSIFKIDSSGAMADRVAVQFGKSSVSYIQIINGLQAGDRVILSDMSEWNDYDQVKID